MTKRLESLVEGRFGRFEGYAIHEIRLLMGAFAFMASPVQTFKAVSNSYFSSAYLQGMLAFVGLMLILEPVAIHILISQTMPAGPAKIAHIFLVLLELWAIEMLAGNLFYIQFSKVSIAEDWIQIQLGLLWNLKFRISDVERFEVSGIEPTQPLTPRIALMNEPNMRIYFREEQVADRMFGKKSLKVVDLFLKDADRQAFVERFSP